MTLTPPNGGVNGKPASESEEKPVQRDPSQEKRFVMLETQLVNIAAMSSKIAKKHWPEAEKEQYPFWIGILVVALLGMAGMYSREVQWVGLAIAVIMLVGLAILVAIYLRLLQGRFERQWASMAADGELFRFLRDTGVVLGFPVEMGKSNEAHATHLAVDFPEAIKVVETYLRACALPEPVPLDAPPGLFVPSAALKNPPGGEAHRVYEVEYRGLVNQPMSIRVSRADSGTDIVIGFPIRPSGAESLDRLASSLQIRLQDRLLVAKILGDIRDAAGVPALPIPAMEAAPFNAGAQMSRAI